MFSGILNVNKEEGISSAKVVSLVRRALNMKKVGHTGTLDLEAGGVLPIVIGKATRVSDYMMDKDKEYVTELILGKKTDTMDRAGKLIGYSDKIVSKDEFLKILDKYKGEIRQIPPMYSALKVDGKKLYDLARDGIEVERKERIVTIYDLDLIDFDFPKAIIKVRCSKGTYIRSLVDDIGEDLKTYAFVNKLTRTRVGKFKIEEAIKSEDILEVAREELLVKLMPIDYALENFIQIDLEKTYLRPLINGQICEVYQNHENLIRVYVEDEFVGLGKITEKDRKYFLKMEKVFYDRKD